MKTFIIIILSFFMYSSAYSQDIEVLSTPLYINVDDDGKSTDKLDPYTHALDAFEDKMKVTFTVERLQ